MDLLLCGMRVVSDLPLPELLPWAGDARPPDVRIRLGTVPDRLEDPAYDGPLLQLSADGRCRLAIPHVAAYLLSGGRQITIQPAPQAEPATVRLFLLATLLGFLCHQRGLLPLHAACVEIDGKAVALAGISGAGKSTLAAALLRRGHRLLADDLSVVDVAAAGGPVVLPAFPCVKLWRDSLEALGWAGDGHERVRSVLDKFLVLLGDRFQPAPLPLGAIYHLGHVQHGGNAGISLLRGTEAMQALLGSVFRQQRAFAMGYGARITKATMRMAHVPNLRLSRMHDLNELDRIADAVAARRISQG